MGKKASSFSYLPGDPCVKSLYASISVPPPPPQATRELNAAGGYWLYKQTLYILREREGNLPE